MEDRQSIRGREAESPKEIPKKGWKAVFKRVKEQLDKDNIDIVSAGVAFYFFLALIPALAAIVSVYGLITDPAQLEQQMSQLTSVLPDSAHEMLKETLHNIVTKSGQALGWSVALSILISLWSANKGTKSLFEGVNIAYDEKRERGFIKENSLTLLFTIGGMIVGIICMAFVVGFPALAGNMGLGDTLQTVISWLRWPVLALIVMFSLALVYKYAPDRDNPKFRWVSWGSGIAAVLWMVGSWLFSFYVNNFGSYSETYGSLAAVVILLLWFNLTAYVILLGAEINAELEHQTAKDTTTGPQKPMGQREAYHADHVAGGKR
ncbi:YihY/virulence factor BrkB family protein [Nafulsella turpanensis]|uniref:YihY/virulence factor BrkB family protein n=1 Tax=Nafulsella turpanensis TaxID=1265690 RepID=UPI00034DBCDE|nr:YihY/virulence factor BrkB family protein [Nafulsella turpanensis]